MAANAGEHLLSGHFLSQVLELPKQAGLAARDTPGIEPEEQCRERIGRYEIRATHDPPSGLAGHSPFALH